MIFRLIDRVENMFFIIFAVNSYWLPSENFLFLVIIKKYWHSFSLVAKIIFMVDQSLLVSKVVRGVELATVNYFTSSVTTTGYMELPFWINHKFVVRIERTNESFDHLIFWILYWFIGCLIGFTSINAIYWVHKKNWVFDKLIKSTIINYNDLLKLNISHFIFK